MDMLRLHDNSSIHLNVWFFFGASCSQERQEEVRIVLQMPNVEFESKYLGLQTPES